MVGFDKYDRRARLLPGLLLVAPVTLVVIAFGLKRYSEIAVASGVLGSAGVGYLLAILVRQLGKQLEPKLERDWGGRPTTDLLRTRTFTENPVLQDSWRKAVEKQTGIKLLDAGAEGDDAILADNTIDAVVKQLLGFSVNKDYPRIRDELIQYGFERNYFAARWYGRAVAALCVAALVFGLVDRGIRIGGDKPSLGGLAVAAVIDGLLMTMWLLTPSKKRTQQSGERYARQLLQAVTVETNKPHG